MKSPWVIAAKNIMETHMLITYLQENTQLKVADKVFLTEGKNGITYGFPMGQLRQLIISRGIYDTMST